MKEFKLNTSELRQYAEEIHAGDMITLSGTIYTARDAAHKRLFQLLDEGKELPLDIKDAVIYYAGPTAAKPGEIIGSVGPTTSGRMDPFAPRLLDMGLAAMIGKGGRSAPVVDAIKRNKAIYFCAIGGAGAAISGCVKKLDVIAFEELGCESMKRLEIENMPVVCTIDCHGGNVFEEGRAAYEVK
ncbi:Fe-S-containing hydro-lyase [Acidaminobacterium chupaoyuni]